MTWWRPHNEPDSSPKGQDRQSLPLCLRHSTPQCAAEDALRLVYLLDDISLYRLGDPEISIDRQSEEGLRLVYSLLKDKLAIASGEYLFPLNGNKDDAVLAERVEP